MEGYQVVRGVVSVKNINVVQIPKTRGPMQWSTSRNKQNPVFALSDEMLHVRRKMETAAIQQQIHCLDKIRNKTSSYSNPA